MSHRDRDAMTLREDEGFRGSGIAVESVPIAAQLSDTGLVVPPGWRGLSFLGRLPELVICRAGKGLAGNLALCPTVEGVPFIQDYGSGLAELRALRRNRGQLGERAGGAEPVLGAKVGCGLIAAVKTRFLSSIAFTFCLNQRRNGGDLQ